MNCALGKLLDYVAPSPTFMNTESKSEVVQFGTRRIIYNLYRSDRKHIRIVVSPDLAVKVYAPRRTRNSRIHGVVLSKAGWIARKLDEVKVLQPLPTEKKYISGEIFLYLGRQYRLKVSPGKKCPAKLRGRYLYVQTERTDDCRNISRIVKTWYREHADLTFGRYMVRCFRIVSRHVDSNPVLMIRAMKRRWGSCSQTSRITLNTNLVQLPVHCIEYVIMHELCHLKFHNHSKQFYSFLTLCMPDWRKRKNTLDRFLLC